MNRRSELASIPASPLAVGTIRTYGAGLFVYGAAVAIQSPDRWSGRTYETVVAIAPPWVWGAVVGLLGATILAGSIRRRFVLRNIGIYGGALWVGLFAGSVVDVAWQDSQVSYTSGILYVTLAVAMCWVARAREGRADAGITPSP